MSGISNKPSFRLPGNLKPTRMDYCNDYDTCYKNADELLSKSPNQWYTDHSIDHTNRIIALISQLIKDSREALNDEEKFIIICAAALHDIGMTSTVEHGEGAELSIEAYESLRKNHHVYTYQEIEKALMNNLGNINFGLNEHPNHGSIVADVSKYHSREENLEDLEDRYLNGQKVRVGLLASLLRLSDCLDCTYKRADVNLLKAHAVPLSSQKHWYKHHYVTDLVLDEGQITIYFGYPKRYFDNPEFNSIRDYFESEIIGSIEDHLDDTCTILISSGIRLIPTPKHKTQLDIGNKEMPRDLELYILSELALEESINSSNIPQAAYVEGFQTRDSCISTILDANNRNDLKDLLVFFGGISTRLCRNEDIKQLKSWLSINPKAELFYCYEDGPAASARADALAVLQNIGESELGGLPSDPHERLIVKAIEAELSYSKFEDNDDINIQGRVFILPITKPIFQYITIAGVDIYFNLLTQIRSSNSTILKLVDNEIGKKTKIDLLNYMRFILTDSIRYITEDAIKSEKQPNEKHLLNIKHLLDIIEAYVLDLSNERGA